MKDEILTIPIKNIRVVNPRCRDRRKFEKIVESIRSLGLKKPIQVSARPGPGSNGESKFDLICGQGRIEAFQALGYSEISAVVIVASKKDRMIMSLVENMARRFPAPRDLIVEIERLKSAGYSNVSIGKKLGIADTMVGGLLSLNNAGEERLLIAATKGSIPLGVAIDISKTDNPEAQRELLKAYEGGDLNQIGIRVVRRLMTQRTSFGKSLKSRGHPRKKTWTTADGLVNAFKKESQRQKLLIRKAKMCDTQLIILTSAFRRLNGDDDFTNLLRAESLNTMPAFLADKIKPEKNQS